MNTMLQPKPINDCREQNPIKMDAHSNGNPAATSNIDVRFAPISHVELVIKRRAKEANEKSTVDLRAPLTAAQPSNTTWREL